VPRDSMLFFRTYSRDVLGLKVSSLRFQVGGWRSAFGIEFLNGKRGVFVSDSAILQVVCSWGGWPKGWRGEFAVVGDGWPLSAVVAERFAELISGGRGLGTFGLPQRGHGAEVAEIEEGCGGEKGGTLRGGWEREVHCRASQTFQRVPPQMEVLMHAGMIENVARVRVAELPEPVKNQRSQPGLAGGAQFFAGSADVSVRGIAGSALGECPSRAGRQDSRQKGFPCCCKGAYSWPNIDPPP